MQNCLKIVITSIPTFRSRFGSHTEVDYYPGSIAAREPHTLDIVNENKDAAVVTRDHLNLLQHKIKHWQLATKPSFKQKVLKALSSPEDLMVQQERQSASQKRWRLNMKLKLQKAQDYKAAEIKKTKAQEAKARHNKAKVNKTATANKRELDTGDVSGAEMNGEGTVEASPATKKRKTVATKAKTVSKGKEKAQSVDDDVFSEAEKSDFGNDIYNEVDADTSDSESDEPVTNEMSSVLDALAQIEALIEEKSTYLTNRSAEDLWEALTGLSPGEEAQYQAEIQKRLALQEGWMKKHHTSTTKTVKIKVYILSLPLDGFTWDRVVVDEAQVLRNIESGSSRYIRLLLQHSRALHMLSATPTLNSIADIKALASLA